MTIDTRTPTQHRKIDLVNYIINAPNNLQLAIALDLAYRQFAHNKHSFRKLVDMRLQEIRDEDS